MDHTHLASMAMFKGQRIKNKENCFANAFWTFEIPKYVTIQPKF